MKEVTFEDFVTTVQPKEAYNIERVGDHVFMTSLIHFYNLLKLKRRETSLRFFQLKIVHESVTKIFISSFRHTSRNHRNTFRSELFMTIREEETEEVVSHPLMSSVMVTNRIGRFEIYSETFKKLKDY